MKMNECTVKPPKSDVVWLSSDPISLGHVWGLPSKVRMGLATHD